MSRQGLDYAWAGALRPDVWKADGYSFVCRYLSHTPSKDIGLSEARMLSAAGLDIVLVWETSANRAGQGAAAGTTDARDANTRAAALEMPPDRPLYFAVDFEATVAQVAGYFAGIRAVLPVARIGAYGSYRVVKGLFDSGAIAWGWQTSAWSYGKWEPRAHLQQYAYDYIGGGLSQADKNRAMYADFGQWRIGQPTPQPRPEEDTVNIAVDNVTGPTGHAAHQALRKAGLLSSIHPLEDAAGNGLLFVLIARLLARIEELEAKA